MATSIQRLGVLERAAIYYVEYQFEEDRKDFNKRRYWQCMVLSLLGTRSISPEVMEAAKEHCRRDPWGFLARMQGPLPLFDIPDDFGINAIQRACVRVAAFEGPQGFLTYGTNKTFIRLSSTVEVPLPLSPERQQEAFDACRRNPGLFLMGIRC